MLAWFTLISILAGIASMPVTAPWIERKFPWFTAWLHRR
jgi:hypothetical protein